MRAERHGHQITIACVYIRPKLADLEHRRIRHMRRRDDNLVLSPSAQIFSLVVYGHAGLLPLLLHVECDSLGALKYSQKVSIGQARKVFLRPSSSNQLGELW